MADGFGGGGPAGGGMPAGGLEGGGPAGEVLDPQGPVVSRDLGMMYWDHGEGRIHTQYFDQLGTQIDGFVQSLKTSNGRTTMITVNEGSASSGEPISAIITRYFDGDTMTVEFSDVMAGGRASTPDWARKPLVSKRVDTK